MGKKSGNVFKVDGKFDFIALVKNIFLVFVGAATVGFLNKDSFKMYKILEKPWFAPPAVAFPIVWTILYILMALAAYRIYMKNRSGIKDGGAYFYYLVQLLVNFLWPFLFFSFRLYGIAFFIIIILHHVVPYVNKKEYKFLQPHFPTIYMRKSESLSFVVLYDTMGTKKRCYSNEY